MAETRVDRLMVELAPATLVPLARAVCAHVSAIALAFRNSICSMMEPSVVMLALSRSEIRRLIDALHELIEAEAKAGKEERPADKALLLKLAESI